MTIRPRSLLVTLTLWYVLILSILIGVAGVFVYRTFQARLLDEVDESVRTVASEIWRDWGTTKGRTWAQAIDAGERRHEGLGVTALVVELDGHGAPIPAATLGSGRRPTQGLLRDPGVYARAERADDRGYLFTLPAGTAGAAAQRVAVFDMRGPHVLQVSQSLAQTESRLGQLALVLALGGTMLLALASVGGGFIVRRALRPVQDVVHAARSISADDLSHRIDGGGRPDEIGDLVDTFNGMLGRLETSVTRMRQFTADVSHELRTPLTIMRGEIDVSLRRQRSAGEYRTTLESVLDEVQVMGKLIDDLLLLSRLDATRHPARSGEVALDEVALRVFERREPLARAKALRFEVAEADSVRIAGDDRLLERLISNLVDNAIRHTPGGGVVEVSVSQAGGAAVLRVRDTGEGIPATALPRLFERFYVADPSRSRETGGAGLGLSIVKSVADLHGASIEVESEPGRGTLFEVRFPTA